jgi:hypothetical protein
MKNYGRYRERFERGETQIIGTCMDKQLEISPEKNGLKE